MDVNEIKDIAKFALSPINTLSIAQFQWAIIYNTWPCIERKFGRKREGSKRTETNRVKLYTDQILGTEFFNFDTKKYFCG